MSAISKINSAFMKPPLIGRDRSVTATVNQDLSRSLLNTSAWRATFQEALHNIKMSSRWWNAKKWMTFVTVGSFATTPLQAIILLKSLCDCETRGCDRAGSEMWCGIVVMCCYMHSIA